MINARTWHRLCVSGSVIFPAVIIGWMLPEDSWFFWPVTAAIIWGILMAGFGALQGIMLVCGRLYWGCPRCKAKSKVMGGDRDGIYLDCPHCGILQIKIGSLFGIKVIKYESSEDELADFHPSAFSFLLAPKRHFVSFLIIFLPVVASVTVASLIHEFSAFYLFIPGLWCFVVGGCILDGIFGGSRIDNHGTVLRSKTPFQFWTKIGIWSLFYILAAVFPIGIALQESAKEKNNGEQRGELQPAIRAVSR